MAHIWIPGEPEFNPIVDRYDDAKHERHPHGIIFVDGKEVATTLMCPHCGGHFVSRKGSGHRRNFCMKHMEPVCDQPQCHPDVYHDVLGRKHWELD